MESPTGGWGLRHFLVQKPHTWSLVCPKMWPPLVMHDGAWEEGEGRELGAMWQPPQGDVAGEGFALKCLVGLR